MRKDITLLMDNKAMLHYNKHLYKYIFKSLKLFHDLISQLYLFINYLIYK